jgi:hypothetical protein
MRRAAPEADIKTLTYRAGRIVKGVSIPVWQRDSSPALIRRDAEIPNERT